MLKKVIDFIGMVLLHLFYLILVILRLTKKENLSQFFTESTTVESSKGPIDERLIIIDDDIGMFRDGVWKNGHFWIPWLKITDPDGGMELIYALREPNIRILGITIMMGVASTDVCVQATRNILKVLGREDIPVLRGAALPEDLGKETEAARFIVETVKKYPDRVEIIATGPLTNVATAMMMEPDLPKLWHTLHYATGEFRGRLMDKSELFYASLAGVPDLNTNVDPKAALYVLKHGGEFPIYPNELMDDVLFNKGDYQQLKHANSKLAKFVSYELKLYNFLTSYFTPFGKGIVTHGVVPVGVILDSKLKCDIIESGVVMKNYGYQGYAFDLSDDPKLPKHKIYAKLNNLGREIVHKRLVKRLI